MNHERFLAGMSMLAMSLPPRQALEDAALEGFWMAIGDLTDDEFARAIKRSMTESKFMPAPTELLTFSGRLPRNIDAEAALCWQAVRKAIDVHDWSVASIDFGARVNAVVRNLGGWDVLCTAKLTELDNPGWLRKRFEEVYRLLADTDPTKLHGEPLPGSAEARQLRGAGHALVAIEGQPAPRRQIAGPKSAARALIEQLAEEKSV